MCVCLPVVHLPQWRAVWWTHETWSPAACGLHRLTGSLSDHGTHPDPHGTCSGKRKGQWSRLPSWILTDKDFLSNLNFIPHPLKSCSSTCLQAAAGIRWRPATPRCSWTAPLRTPGGQEEQWHLLISKHSLCYINSMFSPNHLWPQSVLTQRWLGLF